MIFLEPVPFIVILIMVIALTAKVGMQDGKIERLTEYVRWIEKKKGDK